MATALTPLANITLGSAQATVTFSSISGAYRDLILVIQTKTSSLAQVSLRLNSDTAANYSRVTLEGDGSTTRSAAGGDSYMRSGNNTYADTVDGFNCVFHLLDYSATDKHKPVLVRTNMANYGSEAAAFRWANTAAVTTIQVICPGGQTFSTGGTFALYGVSA